MVVTRGKGVGLVEVKGDEPMLTAGDLTVGDGFIR